MFDPLGQFELQICPNGRAAADEYFHNGVVWIEGRENSRYVIKFTNRTPNRVMVIFSVDGLDTIKGQPAGPNSEGYVVNANDSLEVPGWTLDNNNAAEFYFSKAGKSYVTASGSNTSNTGVIGAMVFKEQQYVGFVTTPYTFTSTGIGAGYPIGGMQTGAIAGLGWNSSVDYSKTINMSAAPSVVSLNNIYTGASAVRSASATVSQDVGTGFGDATQFNTTHTVFNKANPNVPDGILAIYYNSAKNLQKMGIQLRTKSNKYDNSTATPFPAYRSGCTPPPGWTP